MADLYLGISVTKDGSVFLQSVSMNLNEAVEREHEYARNHPDERFFRINIDGPHGCAPSVYELITETMQKYKVVE